jgi:hypothetical protein
MSYKPSFRAFSLTIPILAAFTAVVARGDGSKSFVARPRIGNAELVLPSSVSWRNTPLPNGAHRVTLNAEVDARFVLARIKNLSAKALDRSVPCGDVVKVLDASARLLGPRTIKYDLRFHYVKRICAGTVPIELPADVDCSAKITVSAARSIVAIEVKGAADPPCRIVGVYKSVSDAIHAIVGIDVFKRHSIDLASLLPSEFKGVTINVRSLGFDLPPAPPKARIAGEGTMSPAQFKEFMARLEATAPQTN